MKEYIVEVREVHAQPYIVTAETEEQAIEIVDEGGGELIEDAMEYIYTKDRVTWTVREK